MSNPPVSPSRIPPELPLGVALLLAVLSIVGLLLYADADSRNAHASHAAQVRSLAADRALLEVQLAARDPDAMRIGGPASVALDEARSHLAGASGAASLLDRIASIASGQPGAVAEGMQALETLRGTLAESANSAVESARRDAERAHTLTLGAVILLSAVTLGTLLFILEERKRRRRLAQQLEREANHDPLTMLPNRRFFLEWLGYTLAQSRRDGNDLALLYIDLDGFKTVNDRHGHRRGDAVLAAVAERLRDTKRESDVLARIGGDEFALAAPNAKDGRELAGLGARLLGALGDSGLPKLAGVHVGASIGIAFFPADAGDVPGLIAAADAAMYAAKRAGRNRVAFYATTPESD